jgi:dsDNA-binding SOS-regulon protein
MSHVTKKEADAYDRVIDAANCISDLLVKSGIDIDEDDLEVLSIFIADNAPAAMQILKRVTKQDLLPRQNEEYP